LIAFAVATAFITGFGDVALAKMGMRLATGQVLLRSCTGTKH